MVVYLDFGMQTLAVAALSFGVYQGWRSGRSTFAVVCAALLALMLLVYLLPL